ncbi:MAG: redoxin domain-containing protein [Saprospiraceae bacterium]|nr:redoxin domain-containing protein [Saprospiraceae bacterium]
MGAQNALQVYYFKRDLWENVDLKDVRLLSTPVIANKLKRYITELTVQHQDSIISSAKYLIDKTLDKPEYFKFFVNWIALKYEPTKSTLMDSEAVFVFMIQNYFTKERAFWSDSLNVWRLQERAMEMSASLVGKKAPNVTANDVSGTPRSIYDIKAPYIVVFMYNPTCDHCIEETPKLVSFYKEWKDKGLEVYGIALDTDDKEWKTFLQQYQVPGSTCTTLPTARFVPSILWISRRSCT